MYDYQINNYRVKGDKCQATISFYKMVESEQDEMDWETLEERPVTRYRISKKSATKTINFTRRDIYDALIARNRANLADKIKRRTLEQIDDKEDRLIPKYIESVVKQEAKKRNLTLYAQN